MALGILTKKCETLLASSFSATDFSLLSNGFKELDGDDEMKRLAMENAFKSHVLRQLAKSDPEIGACQKAVSFSIQAARGRMVNATMPTTLLSDLFDVITLDHCQLLFECVEQNVALWKEEMFFVPVKNNILRICNDLLRRLSRTQQTVFCGRILLFLARFFPITERSGLNVVSEFNLDNTTVYSERNDLAMDGNATASGDGDDEPKEAEKMEIEDDHKDLNIDYALYKKFWMLQDFFRKPQQCYERLQWKTFITYSNEVLNTFKSFKLDAQSGKRRKDAAEEDAMEATSSAPPEQYFAKYLTNQNLLQLQLSDSNFRRFILVQFLILFQYLQSSVKFKSDSEVLSDEQTRWIKSNRERVFSLIAETPPDGKSFSDSVKHMLQREEQWIGWKNDGCKAFTDAKAKVASGSNGQSSGNGDSNGVATAARPTRTGGRKRKRPVGDMIKLAMTQKKFIMGNNDLTRLWNLYPDNMEACSAPERDFLPKMEDYFEDAIEQLVPANMVEEQYKKVNDGSWGWRALRLLAKKTPHFFTYGNHPIAKLPDYLDSMIRKIVKETSFQDSESAKQLLASMEVKPVAAASASSTNTSTEETKENNVEDKEMEEGEVPKTPTTPTKTPPKLASKKAKTDAKPAEDGKAAKVKLKK